MNRLAGFSAIAVSNAARANASVRQMLDFLDDLKEERVARPRRSLPATSPTTNGGSAQEAQRS